MNQHQIIFGKSKDSILVPELVCGSTNKTNKTNAQQAQYERYDWPNERNKKLTPEKLQQERHDRANSSNGAPVLGGRGHELARSRPASAEPPTDYYNYPPATTRILTDENGHSIKIRIASPPPQRHDQLARLHLQQQQQQQQRLDDDHHQRMASDGHRDSLASDCPLISLASLTIGELGQQQQRRHVPEAAATTAAGERDESVLATDKRPKQRQQDGPEAPTASGGRKAKRRHSLDGGRGDAGVDETFKSTPTRRSFKSQRHGAQSAAATTVATVATVHNGSERAAVAAGDQVDAYVF
jgi:hypothetical protein